MAKIATIIQEEPIHDASTQTHQQTTTQEENELDNHGLVYFGCVDRVGHGFFAGCRRIPLKPPVSNAYEIAVDTQAAVLHTLNKWL